MAAVTFATSASAQGFFGPTQPLAYEAELDAYYHVAPGIRLQAQVQPYFAPGNDLSQATFAVFASWMVAPILRELLSPDKTKSHLVDMTAGLLYTATFDPGTTTDGDNFTLRLDVTPRYELPLGLLTSIRNRVAFSWGTGDRTGFVFSYRGRVQVEHEYDVVGTSLIPYVNAEIFWQSPPAMWTRFQLQGGLQCGFHAFAKGQVVELNFAAITGLQPSRSWTPQVELILSSWF
jgi:hypothetical protein